MSLKRAPHGVPALYPSTVQKVSYTDSSAACTNAFGDDTEVVRIVATTACYVQFAASPTATSSDFYLPADAVEYFNVTPGTKVAAIRVSTTSGTLCVCEMA